MLSAFLNNILEDELRISIGSSLQNLETRYRINLSPNKELFGWAMNVSPLWGCLVLRL